MNSFSSSLTKTGHRSGWLRQVFLSLLILSFTSPADAAAPDTELTRVNGKTQSMSEFIGQGQWVVVNVWSPSCDFCVRELPDLEKFRANNPNIPVLGVTVDFPSFGYGKIEVVKDFLKHHPLDYPLFLADMELASEVIGNRLVGIPLIAIFDPQGRVVARWPGTINAGEIEEFIDNNDEYLHEEELFEDF